MRREYDGGHLRRSWESVKSGTGRAIPDVNSSIVCTTTRCKKGWLPWTPCYRLKEINRQEAAMFLSCSCTHLDSGCMISFRPFRTTPCNNTITPNWDALDSPIPDINYIIVPTAGQQLSVMPPLQ